MTSTIYKSPTTEPTFKSKALDRLVRASELSGLGEPQLRALHTELLVAMPGLEEARATAERSRDKDWAHRISTKLRVCAAFEQQVSALLSPQQPSPADRLEAAYVKALERVIEDEVGPYVAEQIRQEARQAAQRAVGSPCADRPDTDPDA